MEILIPLLIITTILLFFEVYFLWSNSKKHRNGKEILSDERYFELKFNINLLKAVAAIFLFIITFLGYSTLSEIKKKGNASNESIEQQKDRIDSMSKTIRNLEVSVEYLDSIRDDLEDKLSEYNTTITDANKKISEIKTSLRYNPRIYVVNGLKYYESNFKGDGVYRVYFKDLMTIFNEELPKFKKTPFINAQGYGIEIDILEVTNTYVDFYSTMTSSPPGKETMINKEYYLFDIWIASFD